MSAGMLWGMYILPSIFTIVGMYWYLCIFGKKQDKRFEEKLQAAKEKEAKR